MFIEDENFVKLAENPQHYLSVEAKPLIETYADPIDPSIKYPKIVIDDIEICCLHYSTCREAIDAWERRKKRVNFDKIYVIGNSWNLHGNRELINRLCNIDYPVVIFTLESEVINEKCIGLPGNFWTLDKRGIVRPNITDIMPGSDYKYFEKIFDFVGWLNG